MPRTYPVVGRIDTLMVSDKKTPNMYATRLRPVVAATYNQRSIIITPMKKRADEQNSLIRINRYRTQL